MPTSWPIVALALFGAFALAMLVIYPRVIAPLFNEFEAVDSGNLRAAVERVFDRAGFTCEDSYVTDASKRSSHSNAYFVGFGRTKRVVLFDTLVEQMDLEEIEAVLWLLMHTAWLYDMFALPETVYVGLAVGALWVQPIAKLSRPIENRLSLTHEREADAYRDDRRRRATCRRALSAHEREPREPVPPSVVRHVPLHPPANPRSDPVHSADRCR